MNNKKTTALLLFAAATLGASAQTPQEGGIHHDNVVYTQERMALTVSSTAPATAVVGSTISYQWYRNGHPIPDATAITYTVPVDLAVNCNQKFQRKATVSGTECDGPAEGWSNEVEVSFCEQWSGSGSSARCARCAGNDVFCEEAGGTWIGTTCWAKFNVGEFRVLSADHTHDSARLYQFNRGTAYTGTGTLTPAWNAGAVASFDWSETLDPCPTGWQVPSPEQFTELHNSSDPVGGFWAAAAETPVMGNPVPGRFYGPRSRECSLTRNGGDMVGCIFLPAVGWRSPATHCVTSTATNNGNINGCNSASHHTNWTDGQLQQPDVFGRYWSNTIIGADHARALVFDVNGSTPDHSDSALTCRCSGSWSANCNNIAACSSRTLKLSAYSVRCVRSPGR